MAFKKDDNRSTFRMVANRVLAGGLIASLGFAGYTTYEGSKTAEMRVTVESIGTAPARKGEGFEATKTIYRTDKGILENVPNFLMGKFSRSAIAQEIEAGKTYDVKVQGFTWDWYGIYPNILNAKEVAPKPPGK
jgi:hypothetical protein